MSGSARSRARPRTLLLATLAAAAVACGDDRGGDPPPARPVAARVQLITPQPETTFVGRVAGYPTVRVVDRSNVPVPDVPVRFRLTNPGGSIAVALDTSDSEGRATAGQWMASTVPGSDTLVASLESGPTLRVVVPVRAGPIARIEALVPLGATGSVLQNLLGADAFRLVDPYENPIPFTEVALGIVPTTTTPRLASRLAPRATSDARGVVRVAEWMPRTLGEHAMRALDPGNQTIASPVLFRQVVTPNCAPVAVLPTDFLRVTGALYTDASAACADTVDRWAVALTEPGPLTVGREPGSTSPVQFRVLRAGVDAASAIVVPARSTARVVLPAGEYEVVVERADAARASLTYAMQAGIGAQVTCDTTFLVVGGRASMPGQCSVTSTDAGVAGAPGSVLAVHLLGAAGRVVNVTLVAEGAWRDGAQVPWTPIVAVYGRVAGAATADLLQVLRPTDGRARISREVPAPYADALILVTADGVNGRHLQFHVDAF